ncbi:SpoIIE family protein phosphatase [Zoogloea sp.]|uniref:SpoIIE family protein phosphatase n=1 Tax=Zoogloea sp. TaxID=49181 RepID=UPI00261771A1|nr:SpoIIE family protein phosphatase [Zoogloea sp.]MDD3352499.1 SpoIIE family protein phosphatase [Zoogloea sp.]
MSSPNTLRVLVADDVASNRAIVGAFLAKLDCQAVFARDGVEAVALFREKKPDVVLMDLMMPRMDGFEAIRQIRALAGEHWVPIVILSALTGEGDIVQGLDVGADDYLTKPLSFPVFAARFKALRRLLDMQGRLYGSLEQVRAVANGVIDGIISTDERGWILSINRAAGRIFGYSAGEMIGQPISMLMPDSTESGQDSLVRSYLEGGGERVIGQIREVIGQRKDGSLFPMEVGVSDLQLPSRRMFIGVVRDVSESRRIQRRLAEDAARLQRYHDESEREQELAMNIMERQIRSDWLHDPAVQYAVLPARNFSGDVVAVARSPQGALYAMLADATGHGLAAAMSVLPALGAFYRGAARNAPLESLVTELNDLLCSLLPPGHFVASALVWLAAAEPVGQVWVGGVPDVLQVDEGGAVMARFPSCQLPLGIRPSDEALVACEAFRWEGPCQIVLCSDGLTEAESPAGEPFGKRVLVQTLASVAGTTRVSGLLQALERHLAGQSPSDDVSVLVLDCLHAGCPQGA